MGAVNSATDAIGLASARVAVIVTSPVGSSAVPGVVFVTTGGVVSSTMSSVATADTLPAASANCAATSLAPSPLLKVNGRFDAYELYGVEPRLEPFASRIRTAPEVAATELDTVIVRLFVYVAPPASVIDPVAGVFSTSIASTVTRLPLDVTTSWSVPFVSFGNDAIPSTRVAEPPASEIVLIVLPFHRACSVPHDAHVDAR